MGLFVRGITLSAARQFLWFEKLDESGASCSELGFVDIWNTLHKSTFHS